MPDRDAALTTSWLAARWGVDPVALEIRRRAGELFATRAPGSDEWLYPTWQFDDEGNVKPEVARVFAAACEAGLTSAQLDELFNRRVGLAGGRTMLDSLLEGDDRPLLVEVRR
ncbi:MAG: hypothetical protein H0W87_02735 [Actinobacteria bacterium]|nr:hypothetical protein [Actinomycetota bacterium]